METTDFLYCIRFVRGKVGKIGVSKRPLGRFDQIASLAPFDLRFHRVIRFRCRRVADAWERHILVNADRYRERGEWVLVNEKLDGILAEISDGEDVTEAFLMERKRGRPIPVHRDDTINDVFSARLIDKVGHEASSVANYDGSPEGYNEAVVLARLSEGFGSEDISVIDGIPLEEVRRIIRDARTSGALSEIFANGPAPVSPQPAPAEKDR